MVIGCTLFELVIFMVGTGIKSVYIEVNRAVRFISVAVLDNLFDVLDDLWNVL